MNLFILIVEIVQGKILKQLQRKSSVESKH